MTGLSLKSGLQFCPERVNPFRTAVPLWGQSSQMISNLSPKRGSAVLKGLRPSLPFLFGRKRLKFVARFRYVDSSAVLVIQGLLTLFLIIVSAFRGEYCSFRVIRNHGGPEKPRGSLMDERCKTYVVTGTVSSIRVAAKIVYNRTEDRITRTET